MVGTGSAISLDYYKKAVEIKDNLEIFAMGLCILTRLRDFS